MKYLVYLFLFLLLLFGIWPYYTIFRLDGALAQEDTAALAPMVDLPAIRANYKSRVTAGADALLPPADPKTTIGWLRQNLVRLGDAALDQAITLPWVRDTLRQAVSEATNQNPPYLLSGVDYAFFETPTRFLIRIGDLGRNPTHVRLGLKGIEWKITDIIR